MSTTTVYRIRFWDINTNKFVLSEGMVTEAAAAAARQEIDKHTALLVDSTDVYSGHYQPGGFDYATRHKDDRGLLRWLRHSRSLNRV